MDAARVSDILIFFATPCVLRLNYLSDTNTRIIEPIASPIMTLPALPFSARQTLTVLGVAAATSIMILVIYHYATRSEPEPGA